MYKNIGIRVATNTEKKIFDKVDRALTDDLVDLVFEEDLTDLLEDRIANKDLTKAIEDLGLTVKEVCTWYFMN